MRLLFIVIALAGTGLINAGFHAMDSDAKTRPGAGSHALERVAQWYWVKGYGSWMKKDERSLMDRYRMAIALNPDNLDYWRLAAQTLAYDCAAWKLESLPANDPAEPAIRAEYGRRALQFYETSRLRFENNPDWWLGAGFLAERALRDRTLALAYFRTALETSDQTYLAIRLIVRLLIQEKKPREAYDFLMEWYPRLPEDCPQAGKPALLQWIRHLEHNLKIQN